TMPFGERLLGETAQWLVSADLDLGPFYRIVEPHPIMGPIAKALRGLKPLRPLTLFEMAIIAITEQQLSLAAAFHIRTRLIERFGTPVRQSSSTRRGTWSSGLRRNAHSSADRPPPPELPAALPAGRHDRR